MTKIHPRLENDCIVLGRFPLSWLLLNNDAHYPWFILVPDRDDVGEIFQLESVDQQQFLQESCHLSENLAQYFKADKMNIAALGNIVPQLHIHHIVRYQGDLAWPDPVWGKLKAKPYTTQQLEQIKKKILLMQLNQFTCMF